jgi:medium-chain acyl-[acyl-carrier-protein] hydrolase
MTALGAANRWLRVGRARPRARIRLICFPYAGGGASVFRHWQDGLPDFVEVSSVQLPGRETRFREAPFTRLEPLLSALALALGPHLDPPFAFFGHSMGALVAFELTRHLRRDGRPQPAGLFLSGCAAPQTGTCERPLHALPDAVFCKRLRGLNGTPTAVFDNHELMQLLLPTLRADFALCETYAFAPGQPLSCPITAWGGLGDDTVGYRELARWREQTLGAFRLRMLPGDHFFLKTPQLLLRDLAQELRRVMTVGTDREAEGRQERVFAGGVPGGAEAMLCITH